MIPLLLVRSGAAGGATPGKRVTARGAGWLRLDRMSSRRQSAARRQVCWTSQHMGRVWVMARETFQETPDQA